MCKRYWNGSTHLSTGTPVTFSSSRHLFPHLFCDVLVNDMVAAVVHAVLGSNVSNCAYTGNTALRSDTRQPVHADDEPSSGDEPSGPPAALVVNIPIVDMNVENGSSETWPGTHRFVLRSGAAHGITILERAKFLWGEISHIAPTALQFAQERGLSEQGAGKDDV